MEGNGRRNPSPSRPRSSRRLWLAVAALAALAAAQALAVEVREEREPFFDELRYRLYATNLLERGFYGDEPGKWPATAELRSVGYVAYVPPGYPFFLAGLRWAFGEGDTPIRVTQALLVGATVAAASLIALRLFGPVAAVASAIALIATGVLATYSSFALSEVLATATLTTSVLLALVAFDRRSWRLMVAAGVALGLSALVRPQVLLLPAPLAGWAFLSWGRGRAGAIAALALVGATLFTLTPWTVRNYLRLHSLVPVSTYSWINFWIVNNPKADGVFHRPEGFIGEEAVARIRSQSELDQDRAWRRMALGWVRRNPGAAVRGWARNGRLFLTDEDHLLRRWYGLAERRAARMDDRLLAPLALAGALLAAAGRSFDRRAWLLLVIVAYFLGFFCLFTPIPRFRVGMGPMLAVLAGALPAVGWRIARRRVAAGVREAA